MTEYHPLTEKILNLVDSKNDFVDTNGIDALVREHTELTMVAESGVAFPNQAPGAEVAVEATFIQPGNQMQMALIGTEPVLLLQPQYDVDTHKVTLLLTAVALDPIALEEVIEVVHDASQEMARVQSEQIAEAAKDQEPVVADERPNLKVVE